LLHLLFLSERAAAQAGQCAPADATREYIYTGGTLLGIAQPVWHQPTLAFTVASVSVDEGTSEVVLDVQLTTHDCNTTRSAVTADIVFQNGTAVNNTDYVGMPTAVTWPAGSQSLSVRSTVVQIVPDHVIEPTEYFTVALGNVTGAAVGTPALVTVAILDNDTPRVAFVPTEARIREDGTWLTDRPVVTVTTGDGAKLSQTLRVPIKRTDDTTQGTEDVTTIGGPLVFPVGARSGSAQTRAELQITPVQDAIIEGDESFRLELQAGTGYVVGDLGALKVTLEDDDTSSPFSLYRIAPCRLTDTRTAGTPLAPGEARSLHVGNSCAVPTGAKAVLLGVSVFAAPSAGSLRAYAPGTAATPQTTVVNFAAGEVVSSGGHFMLSSDGILTMQADQPTGNLSIAVDVFGYFQ
jgi:hypothetical protein